MIHINKKKIKQISLVSLYILSVLLIIYMVYMKHYSFHGGNNDSSIPLHVIVVGENKNQTRFHEGAALLNHTLENSTIFTGIRNLKELGKHLETIEKDYVLHIVTHGNKGALNFAKPMRIDQIKTKILTVKKPLSVFIYACHSADPDGTAEKMSRYLGVPTVGIGRNITSSCEDVAQGDW